MKTKRIAMTFACALMCVAVASAQGDATAKKKPVSDTAASPSDASAPQLVREGNKLLLDDKANLALEKYNQAKTLAPHAREIAFAEGLSHFKLGDYDLAREKFSQVAGSAGDALADDALYSRGTCDHVEALANSQEPKQAMGKLESAMRTYRDVLARDPDHTAARDANFKAASMWRQIKQQMQQREQQKQPGDSDGKNEDQDDQEQDNRNGEKQDSEDQQSKERESSDSERNDKEQEQSKSDEQDDSEQKKAQQSQEEQVSKEQAERKLREMLQELADRQKSRQKPVKRVPAPRGGKDW